MWYQFFAGLSLFIIGLRQVSANSRQVMALMGVTYRKLLSVNGVNIITGAVMGAFIQSQQALTAVISGSLSEGLVSLPEALWCLAGANIGVTSLLGLVTTTHFSDELLILTGLLALLGYQNHPKWRYGFGMLLGLAIALTGLSLLKSGVSGVSEGASLSIFSQFATDNVAVSLLIGMVLAMSIQSATTVTLLCVPFLSSHLLPIEVVSNLIIGACTGSSLLIYLASNAYDGNATRLAYGQLLHRTMAAVIITLMSSQAFYFRVLSQSVAPVGGAWLVILLYLQFQVVSLLVWGIFSSVILKWIDYWIPLNRRESQQMNFSVGALTFDDPDLVCDRLRASVHQYCQSLSTVLTAILQKSSLEGTDRSTQRGSIKLIMEDVERSYRTTLHIKKWDLESRQVEFYNLCRRLDQLMEICKALSIWLEVYLKTYDRKLATIDDVAKSFGSIINYIANAWHPDSVVSHTYKTIGFGDLDVKLDNLRKEAYRHQVVIVEHPELLYFVSCSERLTTILKVICTDNRFTLKD